jgi:hypothetical protein
MHLLVAGLLHDLQCRATSPPGKRQGCHNLRVPSVLLSCPRSRTRVRCTGVARISDYSASLPNHCRTTGYTDIGRRNRDFSIPSQRAVPHTAVPRDEGRRKRLTFLMPTEWRQSSGLILRNETHHSHKPFATGRNLGPTRADPPTSAGVISVGEIAPGPGPERPPAPSETFDWMGPVGLLRATPRGLFPIDRA